MQGPKTHEQQLRTFERKSGTAGGENEASLPRNSNPSARQSEFPISRRGMNQESDHNKHNDGGQSGHKPQKHTPAEEKEDAR